MNDMLFILLAFALGYICGLVTKYEMWMWVRKHDGKAKKTK